MSPLTATAAAVPSDAPTTTIVRTRRGSHAERSRLFVADRHHVEARAQAQQEDERDDGVRHEDEQVVPAGDVEPSQQPCVDLTDRFVVALEQERLRPR